VLCTNYDHIILHAALNLAESVNRLTEFHAGLMNKKSDERLKVVGLKIVNNVEVI
jgi:hypothetical protein